MEERLRFATMLPLASDVNAPPAAGAAHANPVAVALSATILAIGIVQVPT